MNGPVTEMGLKMFSLTNMTNLRGGAFLFKEDTVSFCARHFIFTRFMVHLLNFAPIFTQSSHNRRKVVLTADFALDVK